MRATFYWQKKHLARSAFSLLELLVALAILVIIVSFVVPLIVSARRSAGQTACASALHQIGLAYNNYAAAFRGWWPMARHVEVQEGNSGVVRVRRWHDYIAPFLSGQRASTSSDDGSASGIASLANTGSPLWGCPQWYRTGTNPGYSMNVYALATPERPGVPLLPGGIYGWVIRDGQVAGPAGNGWYFQQEQWKPASGKGLVYDSIDVDTSVAGWPWWGDVSPTMPPMPDQTLFTPDFNRHSKTARGTPEDHPSLNMLFCDGHVQLLSARGASVALTFTPRQ